MKYFIVEYISGGKRQDITLPSQNKIEVIKLFKAKSLGVFVSAKETSKPLSLKLKSIQTELNAVTIHKKVPMEPYIASLRQLGVMLDAGIAINECLKEVVNSTSNKQIKNILSKILSDIESGSSITDAFKNFSYELGNLSHSIIHLGEQTGSLSSSIIKLADILQEVHENKTRLKKAVRYPMIVLIAMAIAFTVVITMVIPQFKEMFSEYNSELPYPTQLMISLEEGIVSYGHFAVMGLIFLFLSGSYLYKKSYKFKLIIDFIMLKTYLIGKIIYLSMIGRFVFVFDKLLHAGIPIIDALNIAKNIVENEHIKNKLSLSIKSIEEGKSLNQSFQTTDQFESMVIQMIKAGEASGSLNMMLEKVDNYYQAKYRNLIDNISSYIEPILILFLAGFLLLLALGIFLPMWSIAEAVGGV